MIDGIKAFEEELKRRNLDFTIDAETDRYRVLIAESTVMVSLANLLKDLAVDGDAGRIIRFVDTIVASNRPNEALASDRLFWCLEPNDYVEKADYRVPISDRVDRVLVALAADGSRITWVTPVNLEEAHLSVEEAGRLGLENLGRALRVAKIEYKQIGVVRLGFIATQLPFKSSLILAPGLRAAAEAILGWPLLAVAPDRGFLYLWAAKDKDFAGRVGRVVVEEFAKAAYPISTEVYLIDDAGIKAIGEFEPKAKS